MGAPGTSKKPTRKPAILSVKTTPHVTLEARPNGEIAACFYGHSVGLGKFGAGAADRAQQFQLGVPFDAFASGDPDIGKEMERLARRLAAHGLVEYRLRDSATGEDLVVIEPQLPDYWPGLAPLGDADILVLSRFAYLRRRGNELVLESPRAGALFTLHQPKLAGLLAALAAPQAIKQIRRQEAFPGLELLGLLVDCDILFKTAGADDDGLRPSEGDSNLVLWDFHDLVFHTRSTEGRHANPLGGVYPHAGSISQPSALRPSWAGDKIDLPRVSSAQPEAASPVAALLRQRHSTRNFDDERPITLAELSEFLDTTARVQSTFQTRLEPGEDAPELTFAMRPYPAGGASYELELYLAVNRCEGLAKGLYHYDAGDHALVRIDARLAQLDALLRGAAFAMDAAAAPQVLIVITARFGRVAWKYSSLAYSLILKDVGVLLQTFYLAATEMELGGCAIGNVNIDLFAKMTGLDFHVEGPVGEFAIGRGAEPEAGLGST